jgi:hypothetical protein
MPAIRIGGIAKHFAPSQSDLEDNAECLPYREVTFQADSMPEFLAGKPMATLDEVKANIAKRLLEDSDDFYWDEPDEAERAAIPGVVCVMRYVDMRNSSADFSARLTAAAGELRSLPIRMATKSRNGLYAWIETRGDIDTLLVAGNGKIHLTRLLGGLNSLDWGYEGCQARLLRWYGDRLIVVSFEQGHYVRAIEPISGEETGFWLSGRSQSWLIDGEILLWLSDERGLVQTAALPSLRRGFPMPFSQASGLPNRQIQLKMLPEGKLGLFSSARGGYLIETLKLPSPSQRAALWEAEALPTDQFLDVIDANLFPDFRAPWPARLLLETFAYPFLREATSDAVWGPRPVWLPLYWHHHLLSTGRQDEAGELLKWLDHIASLLHSEAVSIGWRPEWDPQMARISFAILHVRRTSRFVAEALRSKKLPEGSSCLLFDPVPRSLAIGSRVDPSRYPPVLRQAFEELRTSESASLRLSCS